MLWTIAALLLMLWLLGLVGNYTLGGLIHVLLFLAAMVVVLRLVQGRSII
ncbi:MAG: lmo0937 family membrane protein [Acidobacteria bacterium]|nr:MAG: lmo0937 family membrane protein [Acidobacteriota bacterium]